MSVDIFSVRRSSPSRLLHVQADPLYTGCKSVDDNRHIRQAVELGMLVFLQIVVSVRKPHLERMGTLTTVAPNVISTHCIADAQDTGMSDSHHGCCCSAGLPLVQAERAGVEIPCRLLVQ